MADVLANGFGSVGGSRSAPQTLLSVGGGAIQGANPVAAAAGGEMAGMNFVELLNTDATNWLFAKAQTDTGAYCVALPGQSCTIAMGPPNAGNVRKVIGFGAAPSDAGNQSVLVVVKSKKIP